ncbi:hypothetical protein PoB_004730800 [Plakobranchus ocellatus]|uniref:Secreted protein n=1 Tax=Plakobranchus ocellatus TaxID=259542 RepID=A0AAV4BPT4_9GAST|nr:hypothetical protein PoB_004730800 [Plakobranchus ocellatus]
MFYHQPLRSLPLRILIILLYHHYQVIHLQFLPFQSIRKHALRSVRCFCRGFEATPEQSGRQKSKIQGNDRMCMIGGTPPSKRIRRDRFSNVQEGSRVPWYHVISPFHYFSLTRRGTYRALPEHLRKPAFRELTLFLPCRTVDLTELV